MQESPVEKIKQQFDFLSSSENDYIIRECIAPKTGERNIIWRNEVKQNGSERSLKAQKYFNFCHQYIAFFKSKSFHFLFKDYSLGRFFYEFDENNFLLSYNLYWCPCPLSMDFINEIAENDLDVSEYIANIDHNERIDLNHIILRTPIRLDYVREYDDKYRQYHPSFHMHFQEKDTRAKTKNIFSLYSYMLFILENCYPDIYTNDIYEEKIETLRKLDAETVPWRRIKDISRNSCLGEKIHTQICLN